MNKFRRPDSEYVDGTKIALQPGERYCVTCWDVYVVTYDTQRWCSEQCYADYWTKYDHD